MQAFFAPASTSTPASISISTSAPELHSARIIDLAL
jgi:hypothetical protein